MADCTGARGGHRSQRSKTWQLRVAASVSLCQEARVHMGKAVLKAKDTGDRCSETLMGVLPKRKTSSSFLFIPSRLQACWLVPPTSSQFADLCVSHLQTHAVLASRLQQAVLKSQCPPTLPWPYWLCYLCPSCSSPSSETNSRSCSLPELPRRRSVLDFMFSDSGMCAFMS